MNEGASLPSRSSSGMETAAPAQPLLHVVLVEPEIHTNTGNIGRLCVAAGAALHLIEPLGFEITDARLKRAGLDYWPRLRWHRYADLAAFVAAHAQRGGNWWYTTGRGLRRYTDVCYQPGDTIFFGRESVGLPEELLTREAERTIRIPILPEARSLNLAHAAGIVLFEALRQLGEAGFPPFGEEPGAGPPISGVRPGAAVAPPHPAD